MTKVIAHQGASARYPGNTVEAFLEAARLGADMVELDVHLTADGAIAVHHDADVPGLGPLAEARVADLPEWLPLLPDAMDACAGMAVNIEIKVRPEQAGGDQGGPLAAAVASYVTAEGLESQVIVSSFLLATVDAVLAAAPAIPTAWLTGRGWDHHRAVATAARHGHAAIHPEHDEVTEALVAAAHDAGLAVNAWTCDDPDRMRLLASWGVDGIVTNLPDLALQALRP